MQMLKCWNVPQSVADGHDKPLLLTLKEHDITTYGRSDWSVVREWWLAEWREWGGDVCTEQREAKCWRNVFHGKSHTVIRMNVSMGRVFLSWLLVSVYICLWCERSIWMASLFKLPFFFFLFHFNPIYILLPWMLPGFPQRRVLTTLMPRWIMPFRSKRCQHFTKQMDIKL